MGFTKALFPTTYSIITFLPLHNFIVKTSDKGMIHT